MGNIPFHSQVAGPNGSRFATLADAVGGGGGGKGFLGDLYQPFGPPHIAANASGPVVTNVGTSHTAPSLTNMVFVPWNAVDGNGKSRFNRQNQNWVTAAAAGAFTPAASPTNQGGCWNIATDNTHFQITPAASSYSPVNLDVHMQTNSRRVVYVWQAVNFFSGSQGRTDTTLFVEEGGQLRNVNPTGMPEAFTSSGGLTYKDVTMADTRASREWLMRLHAECFFMGVYVEQGAVVYAARPRPTIVIDGDSWVQGFNGSWQEGAGTGAELGSFRTFGIVDAFEECTGFKVIRPGQGGTGYFNANNGAATARDTYYNFSGYGNFSTFLSNMRNTSYLNKFAAKKPILYVIQGTANDGSLAGNPLRSLHAARIIAGLDDLMAKDTGVPIALISNQPKGDPVPGSGSEGDLVRLGIYDAAMARMSGSGNGARNNVIGFIDQMDYTDGAGANGSPANSQFAQIVGPDGLHANRGGARYVGRRWADDMARLPISLDRVNECLAAA